MKTEIIYEDKDILVVRKLSGFATQTARVGQQDVVSELKNYLRQPYLGIIHRLDQPVEGLLVFAKHRRAAAELTVQLQDQEETGALHKRYYAVLCARPAQNEGRFEDFIFKNATDTAIVMRRERVTENVRGAETAGIASVVKHAETVEYADTAEDDNGQKKAPLQGGKRAALSYCVLQNIDNPAELTLADIVLETGRFHQIRAQMAYHGYPLLGDVKYGDDASKALSQRLGVKNVALCAYRLEFVHPIGKRKMNFQIEPQGQIFSYFSFITKHSLS